MTSLTDLITLQVKEIDVMSRAFTNLKKKKGSNTLGAIEARRRNLEDKWQIILQRHKDILHIKTPQDESSNYFKESMIESAEEIYLDELAKFLDEAEAVRGGVPNPGTSNSSNTSIAIPQSPAHRRKLPPVQLPTFSGKYADWQAYKDLFQVILADCEDLSDVERLYYLKSSLRDDAAQTIKNIPVTEQNYKRAWDKLVSHYDNKKSLVNSALSDLFQIPAVSKESAINLRQLRNATKESIETLEALGRPVDKWDDLLVFMTTQRLDSRTCRDWQTTRGDSAEPATFKELDAFLKTRIEALEFVEQPKHTVSIDNSTNKKTSSSSATNKSQQSNSRVSVHTASQSSSKTPQCSFCKGSHYVSSCEGFRALALDNRKTFVMDNKLCFNCLGSHLRRDCRTKKTCKQCQGLHHTLLHGSKEIPAGSFPASQEQSQSESQPSSQKEQKPSVCSHNINVSENSILLATARVIVSTDLQRKAEFRALVDPCSEATFISESLAQQLRLRRQASFIPISGVGGARCKAVKAQATIIISPLFNNSKTWKLNALILPHITDYVPSQRISKQQLSFAADLCLADPRINSGDSVELIIGADLYPQLLQDGLRKCDSADVVAQATELGWILTGKPLSSSSVGDTVQNVSCHQISVDRALQNIVEKFWIQEEVSTKPQHLTEEEAECENHFTATHHRDSHGRYVLRLPFKSDVAELGDSSSAAQNMLQRMERRFSKQTQLHEQYKKFMQEYISLDHMSQALKPISDSNQKQFFLPHHGVFKDDGKKQKLRVVFNGSVKLNDGLALNDCLHVGPKLQNDIFDILLRWRMFRYVLSADIEKMFRQILIAEPDRRYQQIYWRFNSDEPVSAFALHTVTYGLASSPYQAIRTLHQLAKDEAHRFPTASQILKNNSYVDDILAGADTLDQLLELKEELSQLLMAGGFPLGKWTANHTSILANLPSDKIASSQSLSWPQEEAFQMLGISWQPNEDCFRFHLQKNLSNSLITKRTTLSLIGRLYDPLGWIAPIVISFKIFMQHLWLVKLQWDEQLPRELQDRWQVLLSNLSNLSELRVPRWTGTSSDSFIELHGFADASQLAYCAVVYLRTFSSSTSTKCVILASKTKVAPLKQVSLPRLELCAAHLLTTLVKHIQLALSLQTIAVHLWSDSTIVLSWLQGHPNQWKTYVANRVSEIQTNLPHAYWHHVSGIQNPADMGSRGVSAQSILSSSLWLHGPDFLLDSNEPWMCESNHAVPQIDLESRTKTCAIIDIQPENNELLHRYSKLNTLLRVTARCLEFIRRLRAKKLFKKTANDSKSINISREFQELTPYQLDSTLKLWISIIQHLHFKTELTALAQDQPVSKQSSLIRLNPFLDEEGLLRVGGRLRHSLLHPDEKHPFILPSTSQLSLLLVREAHMKTLHGGTQLTLSHLRRRFWILRGRQLIKRFIFQCIPCWRHKAKASTQLMADLPGHRVQQCRPFLRSGVDYAGPINLKCSKIRGTKSYKGYIAIFVCLPTRAVHLEVASGYSTEDFLRVYRRFVGRRGICATLFSDCGTNFIGADKELRQLFAQAKAQSSEIARLLANEGTEWRFNPPSAPHFGGLWEAAVKRTKFHLKRIIGESLLTFEEMSTLLTQIEACLNSRPLQPLRDDPTDLAVLTPAHFLIGSAICTVPEPSTMDIPLSRLSRAQLLRNMYEHFWSRWSNEYLHELQQRPKWQRKNSQVQVGQMCLLRSELTPPCKWPLARITEVLPGKDGLTRVVRLKTATTSLTRPIAKISILPFYEDCSPTLGEGGRDVADLNASTAK